MRPVIFVYHKLILYRLDSVIQLEFIQLNEFNMCFSNRGRSLHDKLTIYASQEHTQRVKGSYGT